MNKTKGKIPWKQHMNKTYIKLSKYKDPTSFPGFSRLLREVPCLRPAGHVAPKSWEPTRTDLIMGREGSIVTLKM